MSLADLLAEPPQHYPKGSCRIDEILTSLPESEAEALRRALNDPNYTTQGIADALAHVNIDISSSTVRRHRKKQCRCSDVS